ncbi:MAG: hypothetical protein NXH78_08690 [Hyphomonadaceae bacterium]|nr:hypothetical protein [Hyphomonadaceae bacterium]
MDPDKEAKRRKSIAYILRRRKRGRRVGANSGGVVKSWAEYSEVNFTPTGSYASGWRRLIWLLALPFAVFAPIIIIASTRDAHRITDWRTPWFGWIIIGLLAAVSAGVAAIVLIYFLTSIWRFIHARLPHKNE